jgi:hypothetical protein
MNDSCVFVWIATTNQRGTNGPQINQLEIVTTDRQAGTGYFAGF